MRMSDHRLFKNAGRKRFLSAIFVILSGLFGLEAAPRGQYYQDPNAVAIREMRDCVEDVRHAVNNHEAEIRVFDEKLKNFDSMIESVRDQLGDSTRQHKEQLKGNSANLEAKIGALEETSKGLLSDLRQFKVHSNETTLALTQYRQKLSDIEKSIDQQNQNIDHLQAAMRALMEALNGKPAAPAKGGNSPSDTVGNEIGASAGRTYKIKAGDSLEKIARSHQTTTQAIKTANGLMTDKIVVGKTLIIPEK